MKNINELNEKLTKLCVALDVNNINIDEVENDIIKNFIIDLQEIEY